MLELFLSALISFGVIALVLHYVEPSSKRKLVGYINPFDLTMHFLIFTMSGEASHAKLAAQLAGVMVTIYLRSYRHFYGYERWSWSKLKWLRTPGAWT